MGRVTEAWLRTLATRYERIRELRLWRVERGAAKTAVNGETMLETAHLLNTSSERVNGLQRPQLRVTAVRTRKARMRVGAWCGSALKHGEMAGAQSETRAVVQAPSDPPASRPRASAAHSYFTASMA
ncbi:hypothetical protein J1614_003478 [Plenodomus biglobosus]|nr:hypothetical protein J1614_003478 [Plenodomus biglobosus]